MPAGRSADASIADPSTARRTRRRLLATAAAGAGGAVGLAGCLGVAGGDDRTDADGTGDRDGEGRGGDRADEDGGESNVPSQPIDVAVDEPAAEATVSMLGDHANRFGPQLVWIVAGGRVVWRNDDPDHDHDVASIPGRVPDGASGWSTGLLRTRETYRRTFTEPGVYDYVCTPHASRMAGRVVVGRPDPETEPALSAGDDGLAGDEARAVLAALDDRTLALLGDDAPDDGDETDCDCPD